MTDRHRDTNGAPIGGYDTPLNAPDGYATFTHTPTAAELAAYEARVVYDAAIEDATPDMPSEIVAVSTESARLLCEGGDQIRARALGLIAQAWWDSATDYAREVVARGDTVETDYAIMRAATNDN